MNLPDPLQSALGFTHAFPRELGRVGMAMLCRIQDLGLPDSAGPSEW